MSSSSLRVRGRFALGMWCLLALAVPAQTLEITHVGQAFDYLGTSVAVVGDIDQDGIFDYAMGAPGWPGTANPNGRVDVRSGAAHGLIRSHAGTQLAQDFGRSVARIGDVDLDGVPDYAIGSPMDHAFGFGHGSVRMFSGATGAPLWARGGSYSAGRFGESIAAAGDVDADGVPDVIATEPNALLPLGGRAWVMSGTNGVTLHSIEVTAPTGGRVDAVAGGADLDHDGHADVLIGSCTGGTTCNGIAGAASVRVVSGATGALIHLHVGNGEDAFGAAVEFTDDLDGDGIDDYAIGAPWTDLSGAANAGRVSVYSGATHAAFLTLDGLLANDRFGSDIRGRCDLDGDGATDLVVSAPWADTPNGVNTGTVTIVTASGTPIAVFHGSALDQNAGFGSAIDCLTAPCVRGKLLIGIPECSAIANRAGAVYVLETSAFGVPASVVNLGTSCGLPLEPVLSSTPPVLGQPVTISVQSVFPNALLFLAVSFAPVAPLVIPTSPPCTVYVDAVNPANFFLFPTAFTDPTGAWSLTLSLPPPPAALGVEVILQVRLCAPAGPPGPLSPDWLSNGLRLRFGCPL
ncbi:MAG: hypothetical protein CMJ83_16015 [Planctomycetes bacterium]|nr:hypothetical protein [Planctomycetota bacterium]